jgi:hypothetical protein
MSELGDFGHWDVPSMEDNTQDIDPQTDPVESAEAVVEETAPVESIEPVAPMETAAADEPAPTDPTPQPVPDPVADLDAEIDKLDVLDEDAVRSTLKRVLSTATDAQKRAEAAESRSRNASVYAERDTAFTAVAKKYGVSKIEVERTFDEQLAAVAKLGYSGDEARLRATARWEMVLEGRKDKPAPTVRAATAPAPATQQTITRAGAAALPRGGTVTPPAPKKPIPDRVRAGEYGAFENL